MEQSGNKELLKSERDEFGQERKRIEPAGATLFEYDDNFRLTKAQLFAPDDTACRTALRTTTFRWDNNDNLLERFENGVATLRCTYTGLDKVATRQEADKNIPAVAYKYDGEERLVEVQNEKGESYRFERDPVARVIKETDYWNHSQSYQYNGLGDLIEHKSSHNTISMDYDPLGRLKSRSFPDKADEGFEWDENGNLLVLENGSATVERRYDKDNRLIGELQWNRGDTSFIVLYNYDSFGFLQERSSFYDVTEYDDDPLTGNFRIRKSGQRNEVRYSYGRDGSCQSITINGKEFRFDHDELGRIKKEEFPEFYRTSEYDNFGRLKEQKIVDKRDLLELISDTKVLAHRSYGYDDRDNLNRRTDHIRNQTFQYEYSPNGNLTKAVDPDHQTHHYRPDPAGNLLQRTGSNGEFEAYSHIPGESPLSAPQSEQRESWSYNFDQQGRCVTRTGENSQHTFEWDSESQLINSKPIEGETTKYGYDASGRRIKKQTGDRTTEFYWDGDTLSADKVDGKIREFVYYPGTFEPFAMIEDEALYIYNNDINGAPLELFNDDGKPVWSAEYSALGEVTKTFENSVDNLLRLQGQYFDDETGLHYNRHRYYDPKTGSFISQDPIGLNGGTNPYQYASNIWDWSDPLGLVKTKCNPIKEFDIRPYGDFEAFPYDQLTGHELLQNAWLIAHGYGPRGTGLSRRNPAIALKENPLHKYLTARQRQLKLTTKNLKNVSWRQNVLDNIKIMKETTIDRAKILELAKQTRQFAIANFD